MLALARNTLEAFLTWWLGELAGLIPRMLDPTRRRQRHALVLALGAGQTTLLQGGGGRERVLGRVAYEGAKPGTELTRLLRKAGARKRPLTIRLRPEQGLQKTLTLPLAARDDLDQLLRFEMDRLTPFRADEVCFGHRVIASDPRARRLTVELHVAPRALVEEAVAIGEHHGVAPARVELAAAAGGPGVNLLPQDPRGGGRSSRLNRVLGLLVLVLLAVAVALPLYRQRTTAAGLQEQVSALKAEAEQSLALREQLDELTTSAQFLATRRAQGPLVSAVLAELTRLVPDDAYVVQLLVRDRSLEVHGFARTASNLIGLLEQSPLFDAPQFRSPVTQDPRTGLERFHLSVELASEAG